MNGGTIYVPMFLERSGAFYGAISAFGTPVSTYESWRGRRGLICKIRTTPPVSGPEKYRYFLPHFQISWSVKLERIANGEQVFTDFAWALSWGRITNGEKIIEDAAVDPEISFPDFTTENYTTPIVHHRWEQNVNPALGGASLGQPHAD